MKNVTDESFLLNALAQGAWHDVDSLLMASSDLEISRRQLLRVLEKLLGEVVSSLEDVRDAHERPLNPVVLPHLKQWLGAKRHRTRIVQLCGQGFLVLSDLRGHLELRRLDSVTTDSITEALNELEGELKLIPHLSMQELLDSGSLGSHLEVIDLAHSPLPFRPVDRVATGFEAHPHLADLERESIHIIREAVAAAKTPAMLFSLGKDSMVMLRLAQKAFAPEPLPFPLVNIDTRWKFQEMNTFREWMKSLSGVQFIHYINPSAIEEDVSPFTHGSAKHTDITKTQALKKILNEHNFDFVFGGARRDEEKSRAKERVFSVRDQAHAWDPRNQRPELWNIYNTTLVNGQSIRVFPLSNWTELDIWRYLEIENIPLVPLYFTKRRAFVERNGALIMIDDDRFQLEPGEKVLFEAIRFRSLGCYPLSGGVRSSARNVGEIVTELELTRVSERSSRVIDFDRGASMEQKKKDGYF
jgi:sulfate adenylyltransferase subunit 2